MDNDSVLVFGNRHFQNCVRRLYLFETKAAPELVFSHDVTQLTLDKFAAVIIGACDHAESLLKKIAQRPDMKNPKIVLVAEASELIPILQRNSFIELDHARSVTEAIYRVELHLEVLGSQRSFRTRRVKRLVLDERHCTIILQLLCGNSVEIQITPAQTEILAVMISCGKGRGLKPMVTRRTVGTLRVQIADIRSRLGIYRSIIDSTYGNGYHLNIPGITLPAAETTDTRTEHC